MKIELLEHGHSSLTPASTVAAPGASGAQRAVRGKGMTVTPAQARNADQWAHSWFTIVRHPWTSLVLVPADDVTSSMYVARKLADVAALHHSEPVTVVDAESLGAKDLNELMPQLEERVRAGGRILIAVRSPLTHHSAVPIARAADAAVLIVTIGRSRFNDSRRTIDCVGTGSFVGSITIPR
ncbi:MAG: hypothetical protein ABI877_13455 [Gemmatimonadaceae bacterium]